VGRSPDGAKRNPGLLSIAAKAPDFASLHPGYKRRQQKSPGSRRGFDVSKT
jgi:hypothetical protein